MHSALKTARFLAVLAGTALYGFVPFWQWFTQGYAGGWAFIITIILWGIGAVFGMAILPSMARDPIIGGAISFGSLASIIVAGALAVAATTADENSTIVTILPDHSYGITRAGGMRLYSPLDPNVRVVENTHASIRTNFTLQCDGEELCDLRAVGNYEVPDVFIMNTLLDGQPHNHRYYRLVNDAALETLIADKPTTQEALQTGTEKRIKQRLGLDEEAPCPIRVEVSLFRHDP